MLIGCLVTISLKMFIIQEFYLDMTLNDVRSYISQLLIGLSCVHGQHIMHRDVKPGNFLYNNKTKKGFLADFGLAQVNTIYISSFRYRSSNRNLLASQYYTKTSSWPTAKSSLYPRTTRSRILYS